MVRHGLTTPYVQAQLLAPSRIKRLGVVASYPALALAIGFFLVTCFVLFSDVAHGAAVTTDHVLSFAVLVGTFASGHLLTDQLRQGRLLPALGLTVLFIAGTFYCVTASGGRNAATTGAKAELVHKSNDDRARIESDLAAAKDRLSRALESEEAECGSGEGTKCKAKRTTREERQTYVNVLETQLRLMDPRRSEYPELRQAAKVFTSITTGDEQTIFDRLVLWFPFVKALFCEIATLVSEPSESPTKVSDKLHTLEFLPGTITVPPRSIVSPRSQLPQIRFHSPTGQPHQSH